MTHTVEKIGGTSMSRVDELRDTLFIGDRKGADLYGRIFVVSAFGGITDLLLEHKKTGKQGVYAQFANADTDHGWHDGLRRVSDAMIAAHEAVLDHPGDLEQATAFVRERIEAAMAGVDPMTEMPIVTGYAQCAEGLMREFDRGYSEVTFSKLAALTGAREAIIHKEFHLSSADPKLVGADAVRKLGRTNYDVADQLSNMGMEAIHPKAAKTLRQADVPLRVTNAFEPGDPGTLIDDQPAESPGVEIVTGLDIVALEVFEQDMVGVKGYDATILDVLKRHDVRIVSKVSNANTITHYLDASLKAMRRVEKDLIAEYPSAKVSTRTLAMASVIGRDLNGLSVLTRGLQALAGDGLEAIGASQGPRNVDVQFILERDALKPAIVALHRALVDSGTEGMRKAA